MINFSKFLNKANKKANKTNLFCNRNKLEKLNNIFFQNNFKFSGGAIQTESNIMNSKFTDEKFKSLLETKEEKDIKYEDTMFYFNRDWNKFQADKIK